MKVIFQKDDEKLNDIFNENQFEYDDVNQTVKEIIRNVKENKDNAVRNYTKMYDGVSLSNFKVSKEEILNAYNNVDPKLVDDLQSAFDSIYSFHKKQLPKEFMVTNDGTVGNIIRPINTVGIYVPGGTAPYPSTVLMNAAPARVAGVKRIVMVTPPNSDGTITPVLLVAAYIAGVTEVYKIGGAQSVAALAFGTETVPKVDKIVGPGNIYVATAKKEVMGYVGIDMIAGPSEVLVIADEYANPRYIAADLLAQAEHDKLAKTYLLTTSLQLAKAVKEEVYRQLSELSRNEIASESIEKNNYIIIVESIEDACALSNKIAPEHLELQIQNADVYIDLISNAGAIFVGEYSPEPLGDYYAGPNHTLPTSGTARYASALSTTDFIKTISYISYSKTDLYKVKDKVINIANAEGLTAHANSVKVRFENV